MAVIFSQTQCLKASCVSSVFQHLSDLCHIRLHFPTMSAIIYRIWHLVCFQFVFSVTHFIHLICAHNFAQIVQSSRMDFRLRLPNCTDKHQMLIILTNPTSDN